MCFFYPIANYINKKCKVFFIDGDTREGILAETTITKDYKYKLMSDNRCVLFNSNNVKWIDILI